MMRESNPSIPHLGREGGVTHARAYYYYAQPIRVRADQVRNYDSGYLQRHRIHHLQIRPDELRGRVEG